MGFEEGEGDDNRCFGHCLDFWGRARDTQCADSGVIRI
jgi:hypothetical protein